MGLLITGLTLCSHRLLEVKKPPIDYTQITIGSLGQQEQIAERTARLGWQVGVLLICVTCAVAIAVACLIAPQSARNRFRWQIAILLAGSVLLALVIVLKLPPSHAGVDASFYQVIAKGPPGSLFPIRNATLIVDVTQFLGIIAEVFLFLAAGCLLAPPADKTLQQIVESMARLRALLYCAAAMLVASVICTAAFHAWMLTFLKVPARNWVDIYLKTLDMRIMVQNTLLLAAFYVPAAAVLMARAHGLAKAETKSGTLSETRALLKKHELGLSFPKSVSSGLAVLSPMFVRPVLAIIEYVP
jgi:hypothetical protein